MRLRTPRSVGRWLAATLSATGIYDAEAVRALAIRSTGREWVADPEQVETFAASLLGDQSAEESGVVPLLVRPRRRTLLRQPVLARDVTADNLERWVGWKRFVRGVQVIPDTRGNNLDLAFDDQAMRARCAEWFARAGALAEAQPGRVMVVVAGDGLNPQRDRLGPSIDLFRAHRDLLKDPRVHYLRIQHAQGTHLSWFKDFLFTLQQRPSGQSVALQWEAEHGATVNVVMLAVRRQDELEARAWSLDGWHVQACGVVLANLEGEGGGDYRLGLFTDETRVGLSQELVQFGRAHCNGLLKQAGWRVREPRGAPPSWALEEGMVAQIARWIERVRGWRDDPDAHTEDVADWVAQRLGIVDTHLAGALALQMRRDDPVDEVAAALWASVVPWPGPNWQQLVDGH